MTQYYPALIRKDADSDFGIEFPDFPGCVSGARTLAEVIEMGAEALALHLDGMVEDGDAIAEPSTLEAVLRSTEAKDAAAVMVPVTAKRRTLRVNLTFDSAVLDAIDEAAATAGMNRSAWVAHAARDAMGRSQIAVLDTARGGKPIATKGAKTRKTPAPRTLAAGRAKRRRKA